MSLSLHGKVQVGLYSFTFVYLSAAFRSFSHRVRLKTLACKCNSLHHSFRTQTNLPIEQSSTAKSKYIKYLCLEFMLRIG